MLAGDQRAAKVQQGYAKYRNSKYGVDLMGFPCGNGSYWDVSWGLLHPPSYLCPSQRVSTWKPFRGETPATEKSKRSGKRPARRAGTYHVVGVMESGVA